jgi:hypothetical protein
MATIPVEEPSFSMQRGASTAKRDFAKHVKCAMAVCHMAKHVAMFVKCDG